jgi:transposase
MVAQSYARTVTKPAVPITDIRVSDDRAFCQRINNALEEAGFDGWLADLCRPHYAAPEDRSTLSIGLFVRLILIAYLKENGYPNGRDAAAETQSSPIELLGVSNLLPVREGANPTSGIYRLPLEVHRQAFAQALGIITRKGLLERGDSNSNPAGVKRGALLNGLVHKETGDDWTANIADVAVKTPSKSLAQPQPMNRALSIRRQ